MKVNGNGDYKFPLPMPQPAPGGKIQKKIDYADVTSQTKKVPAGISFDKVLFAELDKTPGLKMSAHAERRLIERNVTLNLEDMQKIEGAVQKAASKGARESLVIYGDLALVASVKNKTIITAMEGKDMKEHIFTNIDSAVIIS